MDIVLADFAGGLRSLSIENVLIGIVVIAACIVLVIIALRRFGVQIPAWFIECCWVVAVAVVVILAIHFLVSLW